MKKKKLPYFNIMFILSLVLFATAFIINGVIGKFRAGEGFISISATFLAIVLLVSIIRYGTNRSKLAIYISLSTPIFLIAGIIGYILQINSVMIIFFVGTFGLLSILTIVVTIMSFVKKEKLWVKISLLIISIIGVVALLLFLLFIFIASGSSNAGF